MDVRTEWEKAPEQVRDALESAMGRGVPALALAFYGRWWQFETWLRQLIYMELRAKFGMSWANELTLPAATSKRAKEHPEKRARRDRKKNAYMATADALDQLAYLDVGDLFAIISKHWDIFEPALLPQLRWDGLVDELKAVRHRSAHCRRPHADDLNRIELALRSLETGARKTLESHNLQMAFDADDDDPLARAWIRRELPDGQLLRHGEDQYGLSFALEWSYRPWIDAVNMPITGASGFYIHARFHLNRRYFLPRQVWDYLSGNPLQQNALVYFMQDSPSSVSLTYAAVDGGDILNATIAKALELVLTASRPGTLPEHFEERWAAGTDELEYRVQVETPLAYAYPDQPFSIFGA